MIDIEKMIIILLLLYNIIIYHTLVVLLLVLILIFSGLVTMQPVAPAANHYDKREKI